MAESETPPLLYRFLEPYDETADQGCCFFLSRWHSWTFWAHQEWGLANCRSQINFSTFDLCNELYKQSSNTVIEFSCRDCAGFLFVGYSITHCVPCFGWFLVFILSPVYRIWHHVLCYLPNIYNYVTLESCNFGLRWSFSFLDNFRLTSFSWGDNFRLWRKLS